MNDKIPEELISAYIDGELTSDEQARVEQALLEDPQSQQLLEDLQALHERLQAIPRSEPSQDYTQQILRRAERAILTEPSETPGTSDGAKTPTLQPAIPVARSKQPANLKHLIWATTALAATLMLALLFRPGDQAVYQVTD
ncbi:MAG: zf-HC2 domain-containing protein, partial [Pirellulaceae bacterium]